MAQPSVANGLSPAVLWVYRCADLNFASARRLQPRCHQAPVVTACRPGELTRRPGAQGVQLLPERAKFLLAVQDGQRRAEGAAGACGACAR